jgi:hypothetical protein
MVVGSCFRHIPEAEQTLEFITRINAELERTVSALLMTEKSIESCWSQARRLKADSPSYWLLLVRLTEAALLCAGNYADNCEYEAAGDFLVNPREILVHRRGDGRSTAKNRHGRLSEQFGLEGVAGPNSMKAFAASVCLEIAKPPLLAHMTQVLKKSERISPEYLQRLEEGQRRIADALAYLAAWRVSDSAELWRRLQESSVREKVFAESNFCRFDAQVFHRVGADLRRSLAEPAFRSPFLAGFRWGENGGKRTSPAALHALANAPA